MFRNQYDGDNSTWSPQGRLHQVEYAVEAVKQGSLCVGLKSATHAITVALKRNKSDLSSFQRKIIKVDKHVGVGFSGLTSDARVLSNYMRSECMQSRLIYNRQLPISRIASLIGEKAQVNTQRYGQRPYGVGLIIVGCDESGPCLYECSPTGNFFDCLAVSIGARSQSSKTYLERQVSEFENSSLEQLIMHGVKSVRDALQQDVKIGVDNLSIGIVGVGLDFHVLEGDQVKQYVDMLEQGDSVMETD